MSGNTFQSFKRPLICGYKPTVSGPCLIGESTPTDKPMRPTLQGNQGLGFRVSVFLYSTVHGRRELKTGSMAPNNRTSYRLPITLLPSQYGPIAHTGPADGTPTRLHVLVSIHSAWMTTTYFLLTIRRTTRAVSGHPSCLCFSFNCELRTGIRKDSSRDWFPLNRNADRLYGENYKPRIPHVKTRSPNQQHCFGTVPLFI